MNNTTKLTEEELRNTYPISTFRGTTQDELVEFISYLTLAARIDERKRVAIDNYRGQTFSSSTNYEGKFEKFVENNERRLAALQSHQPTNTKEDE